MVRLASDFDSPRAPTGKLAPPDSRTARAPGRASAACSLCISGAVPCRERNACALVACVIALGQSAFDTRNACRHFPV